MPEYVLYTCSEHVFTHLGKRLKSFQSCLFLLQPISNPLFGKHLRHRSGATTGRMPAPWLSTRWRTSAFQAWRNPSPVVPFAITDSSPALHARSLRSRTVWGSVTVEIYAALADLNGNERRHIGPHKLGLKHRARRGLHLAVPNHEKEMLLAGIKSTAVKGSSLYTDELNCHIERIRFGRQVPIVQPEVYFDEPAQINSLEGFSEQR